MTAQEAEIYPWTESNPAERLSEEHGGTGGANPAGLRFGIGWRTSTVASTLNLASLHVESSFCRMAF